MTWWRRATGRGNSGSLKAASRMLSVEAFASVRSVLCLGAHPDDVEIGCGGTIYRLHRTYPGIEFSVVVMTGTGERAAEANAAAERFCGPGVSVQVLGLQDGFLPYSTQDPKSRLSEAVEALVPDVVFTHRRDDRHQDHSHLSDLTWQLFRDQLILEYEIPKYDGDLGTCNVYVPLTEADAGAKIDGILDVYATQRSKFWMTEDVLRAPLRLRGVEARAPELLAEGFVARKLLLG